MGFYKTLFASLFVLAITQQPVFAENDKGFTTLYESANSHMNKGELAEAEIQLKNALQVNPNHLPSRILLGKIYLQNGRGAAAEKELTIALGLGADKEQIYLDLGNAYLIQRKYQEILDNIEITSPKLRNRVELLTLHGRAYYYLTQLYQAEQMFEKAIKLEPRAVGPLLGKAALFRSQGKIDQAEELIDKARDLSPNHSEVWYEKGKLRNEQDDKEAALAAYNRALEISPAHMRARLARAQLYLQFNENEKAWEDAQFVRNRQPRDPDAALIATHALNKLGRDDEAKQALESALNVIDNIAPEYINKQPGLLRTAATVNLLRGDIKKADTFLTKYLELKPLDYNVRKLLGQIKLALKEPKEAEQILNRAQRWRSNDPEILYLLGEAYLQMGRYVLAANTLEEAARLEPDAVAIGTRLALGKLGIGKTDDAIDELEKAHQSGQFNSSSAGIILTTIRIKRGEYEEALATASTLKARHPENPLLDNLIGIVYLSMQQAAPAREAFEQALKLDPGFLPASYNLAMVDVKQGNLESAEKIYTQILQNNSKSSRALMGLADIAIARHHLDEATTWLVKAVGTSPDKVEPQARLINLHLLKGDKEKAHREAKLLKDKHPENPEALEIFARTHAAMGSIAEAVASYRSAVKYAGFSAEALLRIGQAQLELDDFDGAILTLEKAATSPASDRANAMLVRLKLKLGDTNSALLNADNVLKNSPDRALGDNLKGDIAIANKNPKQALTHYQYGFNKEKNTNSLIGIYKSYTMLGKKSRAFNVLETWLKENPRDKFIRRNLAIGYLSAGKTEKAKNELEYLVNTGDNGAVVMSSLARIYQSEQNPKAREYAFKAVQSNPGWPVALDTYGWVLVSEGEPEEGLKYLREAISRDSNPLIRYHLAVALSQLGRKDEARFELERVLRANNNQAWMEKAQKLYEFLNQ